MRSWIRITAALALVLGLGAGARAELVDQGDGTVYDTVLNIFWMSDASYSITSGFDADGFIPWADAVAWAETVTYAGYDDWRLPEMDRNGDGLFVTCQTATEVECRDSEYAYMFFHNMSGTIGSSIFASGDPDLALFTGIQAYFHWSQTPHPTTAGYAMYHRYDNGGYGASPTFGAGAVWLVRDGPTPVPAARSGALAILAVALAGVAIARIRRTRRA